METLRKFGRDILDAVNSQVDPLLKECLLDFLDEKAFPSNLGQGSILNLIACGFDFDQHDLEVGMGLNQLILHPIGLKKGKLTATGPDFKFIGYLRDGIPPFLPLLRLFLGMFLRISLAIQRGHAGHRDKGQPSPPHWFV